MKSYQSMINRLSGILSEDSLPYEDSIIIGDNSSGKSDILKVLVQSDEVEKYYFIDAVNRYFNVNQIINRSEPEIIYSKEINIHRMDEDNFNRKDSFYYRGVPRAIEDFFVNYSVKLTELMCEFLQQKFEIKYGNYGWEVCMDGEMVSLSSGYQALLRIFIEVVYFEKTKGTGTIVIDEIDEFLSVKNCGEVLNFLREQFKGIHFIVTTHSADLIANVENANLILLQGNSFQVLDAGDFSSVSQVYNIFDVILRVEEKKSEKEKMDDKLRMLLNNKMSGIWKQEDEELFENVKNENLTKVQKLIMRQIEEWKL